jgi:hypothetical protein
MQPKKGGTAVCWMEPVEDAGGRDVIAVQEKAK